VLTLSLVRTSNLTGDLTRMKNLCRAILIALPAITVSMAAVAANPGAETDTASEPTLPVPTGGVKKGLDPIYNVCRGRDPSCYNPWATNRQEKVLLFTRTGGPRHANLGTALAAGKNPPLDANNVVQTAIIAWMAEQGVAVDWTEDVTQLSNLNQYKAVIFASTSRDVLWEHGTAVSPTTAVNTTTSAYLDAAKVALRQYMRAGGGFVAIHNAFGTEYNWPYYEGLLGNANYYDHAAFQDGVSVVVNADSSTEGLPSRWDFKDEWYNLEPFPTKVKFLTAVDTKTLAVTSTVHPGHKFHPTSWCQYYDGGRSWVTTLGHDRNAFIEGSGYPGQREFKSLIVNGILSAMGNKPFCRGKKK
jgi:type 1 glutamine amidotransferase